MYQLFKSSLKAAALVMLAFSLHGCSSSSDDDKDPDPVSKQYFTVVSQSNGSEYLASTASLLTGDLSFVGNGIETSAARYLYHKEYIYLMNTATKKFIQYKMGADGKITEVASILTSGVTPNYFNSITIVDDNTFLALGAENEHMGNAGWARIKIPEFTVIDKGTFKLPYDATTGMASDLGKGFVDNGKFIMGTNRYNVTTYAYGGGTNEGSYALVYDYPAMTNMTLVKSSATTSTVGQEYLSTLAVDENGDHYFVASAGKYWLGNGGNSGILRIKKGTAVFDENYFLDVTTLVGKKACLTGISYMGNGIAFGTVQYEDLMTTLSDRYKPVAQVIKIDLKNKTAIAMNTPLSPVGQFRSPLVFNGKYYTALLPSASDANIYEFDPAGDANGFKKGMKLDGNDVWPNMIAPHPVQ